MVRKIPWITLDRRCRQSVQLFGVDGKLFLGRQKAVMAFKLFADSLVVEVWASLTYQDCIFSVCFLQARGVSQSAIVYLHCITEAC